MLRLAGNRSHEIEEEVKPDMKEEEEAVNRIAPSYLLLVSLLSPHLSIFSSLCQHAMLCYERKGKERKERKGKLSKACLLSIIDPLCITERLSKKKGKKKEKKKIR